MVQFQANKSKERCVRFIFETPASRDGWIFEPTAHPDDGQTDALKTKARSLNHHGTQSVRKQVFRVAVLLISDTID
jgi:hypothetical protein